MYLSCFVTTDNEVFLFGGLRFVLRDAWLCIQHNNREYQLKCVVDHYLQYSPVLSPYGSICLTPYYEVLITESDIYKAWELIGYPE